MYFIILEGRNVPTSKFVGLRGIQGTERDGPCFVPCMAPTMWKKSAVNVQAESGGD